MIIHTDEIEIRSNKSEVPIHLIDEIIRLQKELENIKRALDNKSIVLAGK